LPLEIEKKFLLERPFCQMEFGAIEKTEILIEQIYLKSDDEDVERRIRKKGQDGRFTYYETEKRIIRPGVRDETERQIGIIRYDFLFGKERDESRDIIWKKRYCFDWENKKFELDVFLKPERLAGLVLLELELTEENDTFEIPPFFKIIKEVTDDPAYSNFELARKR